MEERDFFDERTEQKKHIMTCPHCGQEGEYELSWLVRREDMVGCKNVRCRKRFDVAGIQSVAYLQEATVVASEDREARLRAAFGRRTSE